MKYHRKGAKMKKISNIFPELTPYNSDPRKRDYLTPKRIVWTDGDVTGAENLLVPKSSQISTVPADLCTLKNSDGVKSSILLDYGREFNGTIRILVDRLGMTKKYVKIRVRFGESASEAMAELGGEKNATNDHANRDMEMYVATLSANETNESGFRFVRIDLLEEDCAIAIKAVEGVFIHRDVDYIGSFECDDPLVNQIYNTAAYTAHLNMQEYLWDGIKRDRLVWIGDMQTEVMTIISVFGYNDVVPRSLDLVRDETPIGKWMNGISSYSIWWFFLHYDWYMSFGDLDYLREQQEYMTALLNTLCTKIKENGSEDLPNTRFIDWPNQANPEATHAGLHAMMIMAMQKGKQLMEILGDIAMAEKCAETELKLKKYEPNPNGSKQAGSLLVYSGLSDATEMSEKLLKVNGAAGFSTFLGYYTLSAIAMSGDYTSALDCMREYWGGMLEMGATTFWEDFNLDWMKNAAPITDLVPEGKDDIHGDFGGYCYVKFRHSLCHGWASGPVPFLTRFIAGINVLEPGTKKISVKPNLGDLNYIRCTYPTPYGEVKVFASKLKDGSVYCDIEAPNEVEIVR